MVVNNNAAATMLALAVLGEGKEIILSRGEMVEIGGSFRVPEIMETSGAFLKEIGTTNKTHLYDYERAINENTGALMKVHTSNYKVVGFTDDVSVKELRGLADKYDLPLLYDLGSGLMVNLEEYGIMEPTIKSGLADGADIVLFSGDKLLGGPQGGIIVGKKSIIDKMKKHPLARVLRVDKMTLSAMEATFNIYFDEEKAKEEIPVLNMLTRDPELLRQEARTCCREFRRLTRDMKLKWSSPRVWSAADRRREPNFRDSALR
jgi:L-seryl-tRNA(Ser) seleniumtransferase